MFDGCTREEINNKMMWVGMAVALVLGVVWLLACVLVSWWCLIAVPLGLCVLGIIVCILGLAGAAIADALTFVLCDVLEVQYKGKRKKRSERDD